MVSITILEALTISNALSCAGKELEIRPIDRCRSSHRDGSHSGDIADSKLVVIPGGFEHDNRVMSILV